MTELTCPHCQQLCPPDGRYCAECGCKLVIDPPSRERYVVRESKGVRVAFNNPGGSAPVAEVMVVDSWYCYTVVWNSLRDSSQHGARARREGHRLCAQWNAEHDAALAGEDAQATKGKGSR